MKVRYSRRAANDLSSIRECLRDRSRAGAINVMGAVYLAVEFIRRNREAAEISSLPGIRAKVVKRYRFKIFYRIAGDAIEIVHVRHT